MPDNIVTASEVDVQSHRQYAQRVIDGGIEADPRDLARDVLALADEVENLRAAAAMLKEVVLRRAEQ